MWGAYSSLSSCIKHVLITQSFLSFVVTVISPAVRLHSLGRQMVQLGTDLDLNQSRTILFSRFLEGLTQLLRSTRIVRQAVSLSNGLPVRAYSGTL